VRVSCTPPQHTQNTKKTIAKQPSLPRGGATVHRLVGVFHQWPRAPSNLQPPPWRECLTATIGTPTAAVGTWWLSKRPCECRAVIALQGSDCSCRPRAGARPNSHVDNLNHNGQEYGRRLYVGEPHNGEQAGQVVTIDRQHEVGGSGHDLWCVRSIAVR